MKQTYSCKVFLGYHRISYSSLFRVSLGCCVLLFKFSEGPTHQGPGFRDFLRSHQVPARIPSHGFPVFLGSQQDSGSHQPPTRVLRPSFTVCQKIRNALRLFYSNYAIISINNDAMGKLWSLIFHLFCLFLFKNNLLQEMKEIN